MFAYTLYVLIGNGLKSANTLTAFVAAVPVLFTRPEITKKGASGERRPGNVIYYVFGNWRRNCVDVLVVSESKLSTLV